MNITLTAQPRSNVDLTAGARTVTLTVEGAVHSHSEFIRKDVINAKGDLVAGNLQGQPARLPIGSPNYFLIVDPSQDRGFKYTNEIDGGSF